VTLQLLIFVSHLSVAFLRVIPRIVLVTQLSAILHGGSLVLDLKHHNRETSKLATSELMSISPKPNIFICVDKTVKDLRMWVMIICDQLLWNCIYTVSKTC